MGEDPIFGDAHTSGVQRSNEPLGVSISLLGRKPIPADCLRIVLWDMVLRGVT